MKFQIIVADPPWSLNDNLAMSLVKRGAAANYPTLSLDELCKLPIQDLADPEGCVLALWTLGSMVEDGLKVMKAWGFTQKQIFVWVKTKKEPFHRVEALYKTAIKLANNLNTNPVTTVKDYLKLLHGTVGVINLSSVLSFGMGRLFRQTHEICLIGINNTKIYKSLENKSQRSVCFDDNKGHSIKPEILQDRLETMFPNTNKIEIFSRRIRNGWVNIGNEISNEDVRVSLEKLKISNEKSIATK